jgi:hypothetical protein
MIWDCLGLRVAVCKILLDFVGINNHGLWKAM